jgi:hypothetical protein
MQEKKHNDISKLLRIRVKIGNNEAEISYPLSERTSVVYGERDSTLTSAVSAVKDLIKSLPS